MTQAGYAGNPRYNVAAAALCCVLAGVGVARLAPRRARVGWALAAVLAATVLAFTAGDLRDQVGELGDRADRRTQLDALVAAAGGPVAIRRCGPARTVQPMKAMLAWRLDTRMARLADPPRAPATVFRTSPGYAGEPAGPPVPAGFATAARAGAWTLLEDCS
jgi:hypothetical protein